MKNVILLVAALSVLAIACGVQATLPTAAPVPTEQPTAWTISRPAAAPTPPPFLRYVVTANSLNARECASTSCAVDVVLERGQEVRLIGAAVINENMEVWQFTNFGWVDPQYIERIKNVE